MDVNWIGVVVAAISAFMLGGLWYSPVLFGKPWQRLAGLSDDALAARPAALVFGGAFALSLLSALVFAIFLGRDPGLGFATGVGFASGLCWVAASYGILCLFEARPMRQWLINGGYQTLQFTAYGAIIGYFG